MTSRNMDEILKTLEEYKKNLAVAKIEFERERTLFSSVLKSYNKSRREVENLEEVSKTNHQNLT